MSDPSQQRVLLALGGNRIAEANALAALQAAGGYDLVGRCIDANAVMRLAIERAPDYIFISEQLPDFSAALILQLIDMDITPTLLVDGDPDDDDGGTFQHLALRLHSTELPEALGDLAERSERFIASPPEQLKRDGPDVFVGPAPIVAVTSGKGGPGKTTVAIGLAAALAVELGGERVALADYDLRGGNVATWTGIDQSRGLMRARLPGEDSPEIAAGDLEETAFHCLALAGLERGAASYRMIMDDADRCLAALAANISEHGIVVVDCESNAQPGLVLDRASLAILVCGSDAIGAWNARGAAQLLAGHGIPTILAINGDRSSSEPAGEILETVGLVDEFSVAGGRAGSSFVTLPHDDRVLSLQRSGDAPTLGPLGAAFRTLAGEVLQELAKLEERWQEPAAALMEERGVFARMRSRRATRNGNGPDQDAPQPPPLAGPPKPRRAVRAGSPGGDASPSALPPVPAALAEPGVAEPLTEPLTEEAFAPGLFRRWFGGGIDQASDDPALHAGAEASAVTAGAEAPAPRSGSRWAGLLRRRPRDSDVSGDPVDATPPGGGAESEDGDHRSSWNADEHSGGAP